MPLSCNGVGSGGSKKGAISSAVTTPSLQNVCVRVCVRVCVHVCVCCVRVCEQSYFREQVCKWVHFLPLSLPPHALLFLIPSAWDQRLLAVPIAKHCTDVL